MQGQTLLEVYLSHLQMLQDSFEGQQNSAAVRRFKHRSKMKPYRLPTSTLCRLCVLGVCLSVFFFVNLSPKYAHSSLPLSLKPIPLQISHRYSAPSVACWRISWISPWFSWGSFTWFSETQKCVCVLRRADTVWCKLYATMLIMWRDRRAWFIKQMWTFLVYEVIHTT